MPTFTIDLQDRVGIDPVSTGWEYNLTEATTTAGTVIADIPDTSNNPTGFELFAVTPFVTNGYHVPAADVDSDWPANVIRSYWRTGNGTTSVYEIRGLTNGDSYSINLSGIQDVLTRHSTFIVDGVSKDYIIGTAAAPANSVNFTGVVAGNKISISVTKAASGAFYGALNGIAGTITPAATSDTLDVDQLTCSHGDTLTATSSKTDATSAVLIDENLNEITLTNFVNLGGGGYSFKVPDLVAGMTGILSGACTIELRTA